MAKLYVLESSVIGPAYVRRAAEAIGLEVTFLSMLHNQEGDALRQLLSGRVLQVDTRDVDAIVAAVQDDADARDIAGVVTFLDSRLGICAEVCRRLNVNGVDPAVLELRNKASVGELIPEYVPRGLALNAATDTPDALNALIAKSPQGVIVKPVHGAGAKGYREFQTGARVVDLRELVDTSLSEFLAPELLIAQEKLAGELVSLEGYAARGQVHFLGLTGRRKLRNSESAFLFPYENRVEAKAFERAMAATQALIERSGLENGFFHCEFIVNGPSAHLIDANVGRPGGANLVEVFSAAFGIEPERFYELALSVALFGDASAAATFGSPRASLGVAYGLPTRGRVLEFAAPATKARHAFAQNYGAEIGPMGESNWSWVGLVSGETSDVLAAMAGLRLRTNVGWVDPAWSGV